MTTIHLSTKTSRQSTATQDLLYGKVPTVASKVKGFKDHITYTVEIDLSKVAKLTLMKLLCSFRDKPHFFSKFLESGRG